MTQRVLITAGAGGIGLAIAKAFVANGARVHIADEAAYLATFVRPAGAQQRPGMTAAHLANVRKILHQVH